MAETDGQPSDFACHRELPCSNCRLIGNRGAELTHFEETEMIHRMKDESAIPSTSRRQMIVGAALVVGGLAASPLRSFAFAEDEITRSSAAIHHRRSFNAPPKRVYDVLLDPAQFEKVMMLSEAMKGGMPAGAKPTVISPAVGGAFTLFGGVITGRHIELVPNTRIVQAWRDADWKPGLYSLVKFEFTPDGAATSMTFEHRGFPDADAAHLNAGWKANYWEPLAKYLA